MLPPAGLVNLLKLKTLKTQKIMGICANLSWAVRVNFTMISFWTINLTKCTTLLLTSFNALFAAGGIIAAPLKRMRKMNKYSFTSLLSEASTPPLPAPQIIIFFLIFNLRDGWDGGWFTRRCDSSSTACSPHANLPLPSILCGMVPTPCLLSRAYTWLHTFQLDTYLRSRDLNRHS